MVGLPHSNARDRWRIWYSFIKSIILYSIQHYTAMSKQPNKMRLYIFVKRIQSLAPNDVAV